MQRRNFLKNSAALVSLLPLNFGNALPLISTAPGPDKDIIKTKIGKFSCTIFRDDMFKYLAKDFFVNASGKELDDLLKKYNATPENIPSPFIAVLLQEGSKKILIDTGVGFSEKPVNVRGRDVYFKGRLHELLDRENIKREEITDVIITHFHPDHIGGISSDAGQLHFPNAKFHMHDAEWAYWHSAESVNQPEQFKFFINRNISKLKDYNLNLIKSDYEDLVPGIRALKVDGHTPGQIAVWVSSEKEHLLYISDALLHPIHIEKLDWQTNYDLDTEKAKQSRIKLLDMAYKENMLVNAFHFTFPGLGRIDKFKGGYKWNAQ